MKFVISVNRVENHIVTDEVSIQWWVEGKDGLDAFLEGVRLFAKHITPAKSPGWFDIMGEDGWHGRALEWERLSKNGRLQRIWDLQKFGDSEGYIARIKQRNVNRKNARYLAENGDLYCPMED